MLKYLSPNTFSFSSTLCLSWPTPGPCSISSFFCKLVQSRFSSVLLHFFPIGRELCRSSCHQDHFQALHIEQRILRKGELLAFRLGHLSQTLLNVPIIPALPKLPPRNIANYPRQMLSPFSTLTTTMQMRSGNDVSQTCARRSPAWSRELLSWSWRMLTCGEKTPT